jgi:hypothetical protein
MTSNALAGFLQGFGDAGVAERRLQAMEEASAQAFERRGDNGKMGYGMPEVEAGAYGDPNQSFTFGDGLQGLIDQTEGVGRYDTLFGHAQRPGGAFEGMDITQMTLGEVLEFQNPSGPYAQYVSGKVGHVATPAGRYQVVGMTLREAAEQMGLGYDTPFNAETQDAIFNKLAGDRIRSSSTMSGKIAGLRAEWEGLNNVSDADLEEAIRAWEQSQGTGV